MLSLVAAVPERCVRGAQGYAKTDATFLNWARKRRRRDGSTAVTALLLGSKIFFGWAGDSRGFVLDAAWQVSWVSSDHKPNRPDEMERIKKAGGACLNLCVPEPSSSSSCSRSALRKCFPCLCTTACCRESDCPCALRQARLLAGLNPRRHGVHEAPRQGHGPSGREAAQPAGCVTSVWRYGAQGTDGAGERRAGGIHADTGEPPNNLALYGRCPVTCVVPLL
eukprot:COSAG04_NODE_791_length_10285_cov_3.557628_2_plen_223_part_00